MRPVYGIDTHLATLIMVMYHLWIIATHTLIVLGQKPIEP